MCRRERRTGYAGSRAGRNPPTGGYSGSHRHIRKASESGNEEMAESRATLQVRNSYSIFSGTQMLAIRLKGIG